MSDTTVMDFLHKVVEDAATTAAALAVSIGDRLGLYRAMAGAGALTPARLAERTGTHERYIREWLDTQVGAGYVTYHRDQQAYELPDDHAAVLADQDAPTFAAGVFPVFQALYQSEDKLVEVFRTGAGIGWGDHVPALFPGIGRFFRPGYEANIVQNWLPALDGVVDKLTTGAMVADVGCGVGYSTMLMAQAFPNSTFHGYDYHPESITCAQSAAEERGLADRVHFQVAAATDFPTDDFDLVTFYDCLHDMGDPGAAAHHVYKALAPDGTWMIVEPNTAADPTEDPNPVRRLFMGFSTALCLPAAIDQSGPVALGNHAGEAALRDIVLDAGFARWRRTAETPINAVYEARPRP